MQDDIEKLDKEISDRHAAELAGLEKRLAAESSPGDETVQLAESLYETKLNNGQERVSCHYHHHCSCQTPQTLVWCGQKCLVVDA